MIFLTTGTQEPFDRLIKTIDELAPLLGDIEIVAQAFKGKYVPKNITAVEFVSPLEFNKLFNRARLIVSHAGMGTIISALEKKKPILVLPRLKDYGEHRNDHQMATAKQFDKMRFINVAYTEEELRQKLMTLLNGKLTHMHTLGQFASNDLLNSVKQYIGGHNNVERSGSVMLLKKRTTLPSK